MSACRHSMYIARGLPAGSDLSRRPINCPRPGRMRPLPRSAPEFARSVRILTRADPSAVFVLVAAAIVSAIIAVGSCCHGAGRRTVRGSAIDTSANRRARYRTTGYRTISIAASRNPISPVGNADTPRMNRAAPEAVAISTQRQPSTLTGDGVDLNQRSGPHFRRQTSFSACRKRAFDQSPIDCQGAHRTE